MAIAKPTSLSIAVNSSLLTDLSQGRVTNTPLSSETINLPFSSYVHGSIDITAASGSVILGKYGVCFLNAGAMINVETTDDNGASVHATKMFAVNGDPVEISVSTTSITPITVVYLMGTVG